jgi:hypothetical protein
MRLSDTAGDKSRMRKVSSQDVREIRAAFAKGACPSKLAKQYGVLRTTILNIAKRRSWKSVD